MAKFLVVLCVLLAIFPVYYTDNKTITNKVSMIQGYQNVSESLDDDDSLGDAYADTHYLGPNVSLNYSVSVVTSTNQKKNESISSSQPLTKNDNDSASVTLSARRTDTNYIGVNVSSNKSNVPSNTPKVSSNKPKISSNKPNVLSNIPKVSSNHFNVSSNNLNLSSNNSNLLSNFLNVSSNYPNLSSSNSNISSNNPNTLSNHPNVSSNNSYISSNYSNVSSNNPNVSLTSPNLSSNNPNLSSNTSNSLSNNPNVSSNYSNFTSNNPNVSSNDPDLSSNNPYQSSNNPNLSSNNANVSSTNSNITSNYSNVSSNNPNVSPNYSNVPSNYSNVSSNNANESSYNPNVSSNNPNVSSNNPNVNYSNVSSNSPNISSNISLVPSNTPLPKSSNDPAPTVTRIIRNQQADFWTAYHNINDINAYLINTNMSHQYSVDLVTSGTSYEGRKILGLRINTTAGKGKPAFFIESGIHGREWIAPAVSTYFINQLLTATDPQIIAMRNQFEWHIFPCVNPDGYQYSFTIDRYWRKNRSYNSPTGCPGVDLNRNWATDNWREFASSNDACDYDLYAGPTPFSEPETLSLSQYLGNMTNLKVHVALHSDSKLLLIPYSGSYEQVNNYDDLKTIGRTSLAYAYRANLTKTEYNGPGTGGEVAYMASGASMDWVRKTLGVPLVFAYELPGDHFEWPASKIYQQGDEFTQMILGLVTEANNLGYFPKSYNSMLLARQRSKVLKT